MSEMRYEYNNLEYEDKIIENLKRWTLDDCLNVNYRFNLRFTARWIIKEMKRPIPLLNVFEKENKYDPFRINTYQSIYRLRDGNWNFPMANLTAGV